MDVSVKDMEQERIRAALLAIAEKNGGYLAPESVVEEARDPEHPLHDRFTWDDDEAAEKYRLVEARGLIRRVNIKIVIPAAKEEPVTVTVVRQFESRQSKRNEEGGYEEIRDIMSNADSRSELVEQVRRELFAYRKRYARLSELADVWAAVDAITPTSRVKRQKESRLSA